jgi:type II secretory pathway pseudopilin PulG
MGGESGRRVRLGESGFTIVELLIYLIISIIVAAGVYNLLIGQHRLYMKQRELQDVRGSLRSAANLLAYELRQVSVAGGDLSVIGTYEVKLRSIQGAGIVCAVHETQPRVALYRTWGAIESTIADSALIFAVAGDGLRDDGWIQGRINRVWDNPASGGVPDCEWGSSFSPDWAAEIVGGSRPPDIVDGEVSISAGGNVTKGATVTFTAGHPSLACSEFDSRVDYVIDADTWSDSGTLSDCTFTVSIPSDASKIEIELKIESDFYAALSDDVFGKSSWLDLDSGGGDARDYVRVGGPFRAFRWVEYGLYFDPDGRWWLGRKVGDATDYEKLTGPLSTPSDSGLAFVYYDQSGDTTSNPGAVRMVDIILRGESFGKAPQAGDIGPQVEEDTLTVRVSLRG